MKTYASSLLTAPTLNTAIKLSTLALVLAIIVDFELKSLQARLGWRSAHYHESHST
jgi:hypothetical protein